MEISELYEEFSDDSNSDCFSEILFDLLEANRDFFVFTPLGVHMMLFIDSSNDSKEPI